MRWTNHSAKITEIGDTRFKHKFLWWPKTINGQGRWLEFAAYKQTYTEYKVYIPDSRIPYDSARWIDIEWTD